METLQCGSFQFQVKRSARRRRLSLSVRPDGSLWVMANKTYSQKKMIQFIEQQWDWVVETTQSMMELRAQHPPKRFIDGETYPYLGKNYTLRLCQGKDLKLKLERGEMRFYLPQSPETLTERQRRQMQRRLQETYKTAARQVLSQRAAHFAPLMGLKYQGLSFRLQKTLWGSCSATNRISLNMKLIVAPLKVIDYVVIHELAHIRHKNHSPEFWKLVEAYADHRHFARQWLRDNHYLGEFLASSSELHPK